MQREKISLAQLESFLLKSADILRGKMDASEFKDAKARLKSQTDALAVKLQLKRIGGEEYKAEASE